MSDDQNTVSVYLGPSYLNDLYRHLNPSKVERMADEELDKFRQLSLTAKQMPGKVIIHKSLETMFRSMPVEVFEQLLKQAVGDAQYVHEHGYTAPTEADA